MEAPSRGALTPLMLLLLLQLQLYLPIVSCLGLAGEWFTRRGGVVGVVLGEDAWLLLLSDQTFAKFFFFDDPLLLEPFLDAVFSD